MDSDGTFMSVHPANGSLIEMKGMDGLHGFFFLVHYTILYTRFPAIYFLGYFVGNCAMRKQ